MDKEVIIPIDLMIDAVFNSYNDDTELLARWLFKNGYICKNEDGNYINNKDYELPFYTNKEIVEYEFAFNELQKIIKEKDLKIISLERAVKKLLNGEELGTGLINTLYGYGLMFNEEENNETK